MTSPTSDRYRSRVTRRLRHRSRSAAASVALAGAALAAAYVGVEAALALLGQPPLVSAPFGLLSLAGQNPLLGGGIAAAAAVLGIACILAALLPGRLRRRVIDDERATYLIDDDVLASGISRAVAAQLDVGRTQVRTSLGRRRADVRVTPTTGFPVSAEPARLAGTRLVDVVGVRPAPAAHATIARSGVIA